MEIKDMPKDMQLALAGVEGAEETIKALIDYINEALVIDDKFNTVLFKQNKDELLRKLKFCTNIFSETKDLIELKLILEKED